MDSNIFNISNLIILLYNSFVYNYIYAQFHITFKYLLQQLIAFKVALKVEQNSIEYF